MTYHPKTYVNVNDRAGNDATLMAPDVSSFTAPAVVHLPEAQALTRFQHLETTIDPEVATYWCFMKPAGRPSFSPELLADITAMQRGIRQEFACRAQSGATQLKYFVLASRIPGAFSLGGDLALFADRIRAADRSALRHYAHHCIEAVYNNSISFGLPMITVALVQGDALGGGFEAALACNLIVAEKSAKFGLPEVLFNLFPGMGAYSFLSRRLDAVRAERMILSGRTYSAEELHDMGLVDVVAEDGMGELAVRDLIDRHQRRHNAHEAVYQARRRVNPITLEELLDVTDIWVDAALRLTESDLRRMARLTAAQDRRKSAPNPLSIAAE